MNTLVTILRRRQIQKLKQSLLHQRKLFSSQLFALSVIGFMVGYELAQLAAIVYSQISHTYKNKISPICRVCQVQNFTVINSECKHGICCEGCLHKISNCPKCMVQIKNVQRIYF